MEQAIRFDGPDMGDGPRRVRTGEHKGRRFLVATGYDPVSDRWPVHVYIDDRKVEGFQARADSKEDAFEFGLSKVIEEIGA